MGYVTACMKVCEDRGLDWEDYWKNPDSKIYMVHGKDNITFHSIIFPGLLLSLRDGMRIPDVIVSSEYLNFNDEKISKSKGISEIPSGKMDEEIKELIEKAYQEVSEDIERLEFKEASSKVIRLIEEANKYYDERKPWVQFKENIEEFNNTIYTCTVLIANISNLMEPFMPASSSKIREWLKLEKATWNYVEVAPGISLVNVDVLFTKFDEKLIMAKLKENPNFRYTSPLNFDQSQ